MLKARLLRLHDKWERERDNDFLSLLERDLKAKVIDLGCGKGDFTLRVREKTGCPVIYGADIWDEGLIEAKKKDIETLKVDLSRKLDFESNEFDVVVSNQVLEHLFYPSQFIREVYRILKPKGYAVISTENLSSWDNIFALLLGYTPFSMQFDEVKVGNPLSPRNKEELRDYPPHTRIFTFKGLTEISKSVGFKIESVGGQGYIPFNLLAKIDPRHARFLIIKIRK
ncbi:MAG: class I SAM-dependent methyltransferase [Desulfobacterales bacterium]|nr:class I SAM-dependent methyltransferase [Desulfobacterales bacterium]